MIQTKMLQRLQNKSEVMEVRSINVRVVHLMNP